MKKTIKFLTLCLTFLLAFYSVCFATSTDDIASDSEATGTVIENTNNDVFAGNDEVSVDGYVNGNAFVFGKQVTVSGYINGDLFVMANTLSIEGTAQIVGNIFALAQDMTISGRVNDVYAFSQNFTLSSEGVIARNLNLSCNTATFEGKIGRNVNLAADSFSFTENALNVVGKDFNYSSQQEATIPEGAVIGEINFSQTAVEETESSLSDYVFVFFMVVLYSAIVIILATRVAPNFAEKATYSLCKKPFKSALVGILTFIIIPFVSILLLLLFSGVFVYATFALIAVYLLVISITISILGMAVGNYFANKLKAKTNAKFILLSVASVAVLWLLQQVPIIGGYISIFTIVFGLGIFVYSLFSKKALEAK